MVSDRWIGGKSKKYRNFYCIKLLDYPKTTKYEFLWQKKRK